MKKNRILSILFMILFLSFPLYAEKKEEKKDSPPQKDKYHNNFDDMDDKLEKSIEDEENKYQDSDNLKRREKKS